MGIEEVNAVLVGRPCLRGGGRPAGAEPLQDDDVGEPLRARLGLDVL